MPNLFEMRCEQDSSRIFVLEDEEALELLKQLWQWRLVDDRLVKEFFFTDFVSGLAFMNKAAKVAEQENYYPKFCVEKGKVEVILFTEFVGGIIKNDFIIAAKIDEVVKK